MKQFLLILAIVSFFSCSKNSGDNEKPVVTLNSPADNQQFTAGQIVNILGSVSDNDEIHEVHVIVTDLTHSTEVLHFEDHADTKTFDFAQSFSAQSGITYKIHVEANDHVGNTTIVEIQVRGI